MHRGPTLARRLSVELLLESLAVNQFRDIRLPTKTHDLQKFWFEVHWLSTCVMNRSFNIISLIFIHLFKYVDILLVRKFLWSSFVGMGTGEISAEVIFSIDADERFSL